MNDLEKIREIILEWINKKGHEKCWYYPDLFEKIAEVLKIDIKQLPDITKKEFELGCKKFQDDLYK